MSNKSLVRAGSKAIVQSNSLSGAAGKGMVAAGAGGMGLLALAGVLPFISFPVLCVILIVFGLFIWE